MRNWWPLVAVCLGAFMLLVDVTIVVVALPVLGPDLGASFTDLQWVVDAYAVALAALLMVTGTLADRFGRRRAYLAGLTVFAMASLACGLAPNAAVLNAARVVQGVGAAAMFASTMALLQLAYRGRDRAIAFGVWGAVTGAAAATGPILGGLLTEHLSWRAIFLVNLPISVAAAVLAVGVLAESRDPAARRIDVPGAVGFTAGAATLTYGLIRAGTHGWTATGTLAWFAAAAVALAAFVVVERRRRHPMLDLGLLRRASFVGVLVAAALVSAAAFGYTVYTSLWLQTTLDLGAVGAGLALLPMSGAAFVTSAVTARRLVGADPRLTVCVGLVLVGVGALTQSPLSAGSSWPSVLPGLLLAGVGVGVILPNLSAAAMAAAPVERSGMAAAALNTARQLGFALGVAALGTVFAHRLAPDPLTDRAATAAALSEALLAAGCVGLAGAGVVALLMRGGTTHPGAPAPRHRAPDAPGRSGHPLTDAR
ncbi:MFS transporter [Plantactinospora sp. GCM10030261]|uniref:MFS transporter n=1 Tax=Plantactinospora sp. GCM10030261 TaxID=3273420 RepID=UPI0036119C2D